MMPTGPMKGRRADVTSDVRRRTYDLYHELGNRQRTADAIGCGVTTLDLALEAGGWMRAATYERFVAGLDAAEARLAARAAS